jgi:aspartate/methionine/tyrosine aminotransferase
MAFSERTAWNLAENDFATALRSARQQGTDLLDLTVSNPTACGFDYPSDLLAPLANPSAALYTPEPFGMAPARSAVAAYYRDHGAEVPIDRICLTTSTSEAYSYLFRLLCDPGDEVLVARPSYPLFDFIARLDNVTLREYPLLYDPHYGWLIDLHALEAAITPRTRAIILVHPNNPTGSFASQAEREALQHLCLRHNLALIVDEVFLDYALGSEAGLNPLPNYKIGLEAGFSQLSNPALTRGFSPGTFAAADAPCLTFVLSGLSKVCALPQMKLSWIVASGPSALCDEALSRLEVIADTFLSINAPTQFALPQWLSQRAHIQQQVLARMSHNLTILDTRLANSSSERLILQGGWTVILRVPRTVDDVPFAHAALASGVIVQPGDFYGLPDGRIVLSLLTPPDTWSSGLALMRL